MKNTNINCKNCGAVMQYNQNRTELNCEYCGNKIILPTAESEKQRAYERRKGELQAQHEADRKRQSDARKAFLRSKWIAFAIAFGIVFLPVIISLAVWLNRPAINPFDFIEVSFYGDNGYGKVNIELTQSGFGINSVHDLDLKISREDYLYEGDTLTVIANDSAADYRFSEKKRTYIVEGLNVYLTDLNDLDEKSIELIHQSTELLNDRNIEPSYGVTPNDFIDYEHEKFYLLTDGKNDNILFDVYNARFRLKDDSIRTVYLVVYYENIFVNNASKDISIDYDESMYEGRVISLGNLDGVVTGYDSLEEFEVSLMTNRNKNMKLSER